MADLTKNEVITEETIDVLTDTAKEELTAGGKVVGILTGIGAVAVIGGIIFVGKWGINKIKNRKAAKAESLADENFEDDFMEEPEATEEK